MQRPTHYRGACVCPNPELPLEPRWELRITERCLRDDLLLNGHASFSEASRHPIVGAFESKRAQSAVAGKFVGPDAGSRSFFHLGIRNDHRAATWYQEDLGVIWLVAYRFHRSESDDDFFKWVRPRIATGELLPTENDVYRALHDRTLRFKELAPADASAIVAEAKTSRDVATGVLAWEVPVRVKAEGGAEELVSVAFPYGFAPQRQAIVSAFDPDGLLYPEWLEELPGEPQVSGELVFKVLRPSPR